MVLHDSWRPRPAAPPGSAAAALNAYPVISAVDALPMRSRTQRRPCVRSRAGDEPLKLVETPLGARSSDTPPGGPFLPSDKPRGSRLPCRQALHPSVASLRNQSPDHEHICGSLLHGGTATPPESSLTRAQARRKPARKTPQAPSPAAWTSSSHTLSLSVHKYKNSCTSASTAVA